LAQFILLQPPVSRQARSLCRRTRAEMHDWKLCNRIYRFCVERAAVDFNVAL